MQDDDHDKSQYLPKDVPRVNEFRLQHKDIAIDRTCDACQGVGAVEGQRCHLCKGKGRLLTSWRGHDLDPLSDIRYAQARVQNVLAFLHNTHIITDQHAHDGRTYEIWYEIFKAGATMQKKPLYGALRGELALEGLSEYGFILLIKNLSRDHHQAIKRAIYTMQSEHTRWLARRSGDQYIKAFDKLSEAIPAIREQLKVMQDQQGIKP